MGIGHQPAVHGETGAEGRVEDEGSFDANPFNVGPGVGPNDGRGEMRDDESLEGETLRVAGPPILPQDTNEYK